MEKTLKQNPAIEPDLQNFTNFVLQSVAKLGGNAFVASITLARGSFRTLAIPPGNAGIPDRLGNHS